MTRILLVAKDWSGGLARYLLLALEQRERSRTQWITTYPCTQSDKIAYRINRRHWNLQRLHTINNSARDIALFVNLPTYPQRLKYHANNVLWLTDAPRYSADQLAAFSKIYISDPGYSEDILKIVGNDKFAGILPFACSPSVHRSLTAKIDTDVCFVGRRDVHRNAFLKQLLDLDCSSHIYGNYFLQDTLFWHKPTAFRRSVANNRLADIYARHRISLNIHARVVRAGTNMRTFECAACGIPQLVESRPGLEHLFLPGEEICTFSTLDEMAASIERLLGDPSYREQLSHKARKRVLAEHTYAQRIEKLLATI